MGRNRIVSKVAPRAALTALAAFLIWATSNCDDAPIYRRTMRWERETIFQRSEFIPVGIAVGNDGNVYVAGEDRKRSIFNRDRPNVPITKMARIPIQIVTRRITENLAIFIGRS